MRAWSAELAATPRVRLEWQEIRHRVQGTQRLPASAWIDCIEDVLALLGKRREWDRFVALVSETRRAQPDLLPWLERRPLQALELAGDWARLLSWGVDGITTDFPDRLIEWLTRRGQFV